MKIEMGESLCYSFLRHVKGCWLVQTNWKVSEHWEQMLSDDELEKLFQSMRERFSEFDKDGSVFKGTKGGKQFLKQGEIDAVGLGQDGSVHAMDVAFHENGLNYGGGAAKRVLKKLLRTLFTLQAYHRAEVKRHIYFASPKVHQGVQGPLEEMFGMLEVEYPSVDWHLLTNEEFTRGLLAPTLEKAGRVSDTSELFVRAAKLLELGGVARTETENRLPERPLGESNSRPAQQPYVVEGSTRERGGRNASEQQTLLQPLVRSLMKTLLEDYPNLLGETDLRRMMDAETCTDDLNLRLGGFPILRRMEEGRVISGHARYWAKVYGGRFYVTNNWWQAHHLENAEALARFVEGLLSRRRDHPAVSELERHRAALEGYGE